jgi:2-methylcitrate dehydratase PrpD
MPPVQQPVSRELAELADFIADALHRPLPDDVVAKTGHHIVDTVAAIVSGARLDPGEKAIAYVRAQGGTEESQVIGGGFSTNAPLAAFAHAMSAHADETDDSHAPSLSHPGCGVIPAAWAVAEQTRSTGAELLRAVIAGYDAGCRVGLAIGRDHLELTRSTHSSHAIVGVFGAAAAAAALRFLTPQQVRWALSYAAQQAAGVTAWMRDERHVQKAFVFGGMPARNGVEAAHMVAGGMDGVEDILTGHPGFLAAFSPQPQPEELAAELGFRYEVQRTNIKKFAVGSPAQAAVDAALDLLADGLRAEQVTQLEIVLPEDLALVVDDRTMPAINVQYLVAGTLIDGAFSFAMAHDDARLRGGDVRSLMERTALVGEQDMNGTRQAIVTATTDDGRRHTRHVPAVRGTADDPMTDEELGAKALDLLQPQMGAAASELLDRLWKLESVEQVRDLSPYVQTEEQQ